MKKTAKKVRPLNPFIDSDKHVLNGLKLQPWTPSRIIAANSMGMLWPRIGKEGWDQYSRTKTYPGVLRDIIVGLWLCLQDWQRVDEADAAPVEAYSEARKWAAELGIHRIDSDEFWQAYGKFVEIMSEVDKSFTKPAPAKGSEEEADEGNE
jgi:hypothetical protein